MEKICYDSLFCNLEFWICQVRLLAVFHSICGTTVVLIWIISGGITPRFVHYAGAGFDLGYSELNLNSDLISSAR
jgi:hypothetical protein